MHLQPLIESIEKYREKPVVLIGLSGAGKSTIGKRLAELLSLALYDTDEEVERSAGMPITEIVEKYGEAEFRRMEAEKFEKVMLFPDRVIVAGGGAVMTPQIAEKIWKEGISIWLNAEPEILAQRAGRDTSHRYLLAETENVEETLKALFKERCSTYQKADITVDTGTDDGNKIILDLLEQLDQFLQPED